MAIVYYLGPVRHSSTSLVKLFFLENNFMSNFLGEAELFWKKLFGKTTSPTTSYVDGGDKCGRELGQATFFSFISTHVFVKGGEKQLHR